MITLSNGLSFFRAPLALLFLQENSSIRLLAVILAMITDSIDGYLARKYQSTSRFGAILDPAMDKLFVCFALYILAIEGKIALFPLLAMLSRDFFFLVYGFLLVLLGRWRTFSIRSVRWGKATTALQFIVLICFTQGVPIPPKFFIVFIIMGAMAFRELLQRVPLRNTF